MTTVPMLVDGKWVHDEGGLEVRDPYRGTVIGTCAEASPEQVDRAVGALSDSFEANGPLHPYERFEILARASALVEERRESLISTIVSESGFTASDAAGEVTRAVQTLLVSAEEAKRLEGEKVGLEGAPRVEGRIGYTVRHPIGVVCAITPFNSPLNTLAHKVAPALGAGNPVVVKPASATPMTAVALCEILLEAGLPASLLALVHGSGRGAGQALLEHEGIAFYTFTGSTAVGEHLQRSVGLRRTQLELGSISSTIVCDDADLDIAVPRSVAASYRKAGQVCTSVQRLHVHADVVDDFVEAFLSDLSKRAVGDPGDPGTFVGPMISKDEAVRVEQWIGRAVQGGASLLAGGTRDGAIVEPALLRDVPTDAQLVCEEVFGPVVSVSTFTDLDEAIDDANATPYGLAAGIFTRDLHGAMRAADRLRMGSVHVNQTSSSRIDLMPYGGVKRSGFGQEGPRYAMREMSEERLITISVQ